MQADEKQKLPNLNSLRFFAASLVLFGHVDHALYYNGYTHALNPFFIFKFASLAVVFFFVLSGFLITYLLLIEKEKRQISIKHFYLKRALRIWPVYYLVIIMSFSFFNTNNFFQWHHVTDIIDVSKHPFLSFILLMSICPNILLLYSRGLGYANPTWSIGVEEQFYLIWPWIIRSKRPLFFVIGIILVVFFLRTGALISFVNLFDLPLQLNLLASLISRFFTFEFSFRIDAMAMGALGAFAVHKKSLLLPFIFKTSFQVFLYAFFAVLIIFPAILPSTFYSVIFILIIVNLAINKNTLINLENKTLSYLGKISYGIYMYHSITIIPVLYLFFKFLRLPENIYTELLACFTALCFTILIATLSYHYVERYFLRLKEKVDRRFIKINKNKLVANSEGLRTLAPR